MLSGARRWISWRDREKRIDERERERESAGGSVLGGLVGYI